jgi:predicted site-specific integrase-resolvase
MALERLRSCTHIGRLCEELGISTATLRRWRSIEAGYKPVGAVAQRPVESLQQENERLKRALAEKTLEVDFFFKVPCSKSRLDAGRAAPVA